MVICDIYMKIITTKKVIIVLLKDFLASALSGAMDLLNTANLVHKHMHKNAPKLFVWQVVSLDSQSVNASNGYCHPVEKSIEQVTSADVIYKVGYNDVSAFRKLFKKRTNMTPQLYKQKFGV